MQSQGITEKEFPAIVLNTEFIEEEKEPRSRSKIRAMETRIETIDIYVYIPDWKIAYYFDIKERFLSCSNWIRLGYLERIQLKNRFQEIKNRPTTVSLYASPYYELIQLDFSQMSLQVIIDDLLV